MSLLAGTRALRLPAFRALFGAQIVSGVGTWSQNLATSLLVLHLTGSAAALGLVTAAQFAPTLLLSPVTGTAGAFDRPGVYTLLPRTVDADRRASAISLVTASNAVARLAGPALAGLLYATVGPAACFAFNGVSYVVVILALAVLPRWGLQDAEPEADRPAGLGLAYAWRQRELRAALLVNVAVGCLTFNFGVMLAAMVTFVYDAGSGAVGLAYSTDAVGAVVGGLIGVGAVVTLRRLALACVALGATVGAAGLAPNLVVFFVALPVMGVAITVYQSTVTALVQQVSEPAMLGRMMTLLTLGWFGTTPVGALVIGWVADAFSARAAMLVAGGTCLVCAGALVVTRATTSAITSATTREGTT